jgi:hypothetical protein
MKHIDVKSSKETTGHILTKPFTVSIHLYHTVHLGLHPPRLEEECGVG